MPLLKSSTSNLAREKDKTDPEMAVLIEQRRQAINRHNEEDVKQIIKDIKNMAAHKIKTQLNEFYEGNWTSVKRARMGFIPTHTRITNRRGKIVNDNFRADICQILRGSTLG